MEYNMESLAFSSDGELRINWPLETYFEGTPGYEIDGTHYWQCQPQKFPDPYLSWASNGESDKGWLVRYDLDGKDLVVTGALPGYQYRYLRDHSIYCFEDGAIRKADLDKWEAKTIDVGKEYTVTGMSIDALGNLVLAGIDSSLQTFDGYLDENDQISFTKRNDDKYSTCVFYPVN